MWDKTNNIYEIDECDYCGNLGVIVRPSPFLADIGSKMCEHCWNETQKEYDEDDKEYKQYIIAIRTLKELAEIELEVR